MQYISVFEILLFFIIKLIFDGPQSTKKGIILFGRGLININESNINNRQIFHWKNALNFREIGTSKCETNISDEHFKILYFQLFSNKSFTNEFSYCRRRRRSCIIDTLIIAIFNEHKQDLSIIQFKYSYK